MNLEKLKTDITTFISLQKASMAITIMVIVPGSNPVVVIFKNRQKLKYCNINCVSCLLIKSAFWKRRKSKYIHGLLE